MKIKLLAKSTGLGNCIQFIPALKQLLKANNVLISDTDTFQQLGFPCFKSPDRADMYIVVCWQNWKRVLGYRIKYPFSRIEGFKYRCLGRYWGIGFSKSYPIYWNISEVENNKQIVPNNENYHLDGYKPGDTIYLCNSIKEGKNYKHFSELIKCLENKKIKYKVIGDYGEKFNNIVELYKDLKQAKFYIGTDNGVTHLADILDIPMLVLWGSTPFIKNAPINNVKSIMNINSTVKEVIANIEFTSWKERYYLLARGL